MKPFVAAPAAVLLAVAALAAPGVATAEVTSFDAASGVVTIPSVSVGSATYTSVTLKHVGNFVFTLQGATLQVPATPGIASYDLVTSVLSLPAVKVGSDTYIDVKLLNTGNYTFSLQAATPLPAATLSAINALYVSADGLFATAVPATGAQRLSLTDACWREDGRTKANFIADWDANAAAYALRNAYQIGRQTTHLQVLEVRDRNNPDGSTRQEIDLQYDLVYKDGTVARDQRQTLISGSSAGTPGCTTAQSSTALRALGNQQLVGTGVRARNIRDQRHAIASGAALSPAVNYRRSVQWQIVDPMNNATYVIVTGPGPAATVGGVATQFALKFLSPQILKTAPELLGRAGNFLNWLDDDGFRYCRAASDPAVPAIADCVGRGVTASDYGWTTSAPNAAGDSGFAGQGWMAGGVYRFDVYNDDGWKAINGQAGHTPIATYYDVLTTLPQTFVDMAGSGPDADKFPRLNFGGMSMAQVATDVTSAAPAPLAVTWNPPGTPADGSKLALFQGWEFHQGPRIGNAAGVLNPGYRNIYFNYPGSTATANPAWSVNPKLADQASKTYAEFTLLYLDRNDVQILSTVSLQ